MPGLDGTGPWGLGPGTGRRRGWCFNPYPVGAPWYGGGRGMGRGWGAGWGPGWYGRAGFVPAPAGTPVSFMPPEITPEQNIAFLEAEKKAVESHLAAIDKELERLKKEK